MLCLEYLISQRGMMRVSNYLKSIFKYAIEQGFGECEAILFGSRIDDNKRGGDFDIAIKANLSKDEFERGRVKFFKILLLKDVDLPIDLVLYNQADEFFKKEIDKGVVL